MDSTRAHRVAGFIAGSVTALAVWALITPGVVLAVRWFGIDFGAEWKALGVVAFFSLLFDIRSDVRSIANELKAIRELQSLNNTGRAPSAITRGRDDA